MIHSSFIKTKISLISSLAIAVSLTGCSIPFPVYSPAGKNVQAIRSIPTDIEVGQFSGNDTSVSCRLQQIGPENGETFASYIAKAINEEIIIAGGVQHDSKVALSGSLKSIDVDCGTLYAAWTIVMDISVNNQPPFSVKTVHEFDGNFMGAVVFNRAHMAFVPTIQDVVNNIINSEQFQEAVSKQ